MGIEITSTGGLKICLTQEETAKFLAELDIASDGEDMLMEIIQLIQAAIMMNDGDEED